MGRAVRLYAAADEIRNSIGIVRPEVFRKEIEADLAEARNSMDSAEFVKDSEWPTGRPLSEVVDYALL